MYQEDQISEYFTWLDALWLPTWKRMAIVNDGLTDQVKENMKLLFKKMDIVRDFVMRPIIVHCAYRPKIYNELVKGAAHSAHLAEGVGVAAVDFHVEDISCHEVQERLLPMLETWNMRMEDNGIDANWIHLDIGKPGSRYFKP